MVVSPQSKLCWLTPKALHLRVGWSMKLGHSSKALECLDQLKVNMLSEYDASTASVRG